jgi:hypothetical protein
VLVTSLFGLPLFHGWPKCWVNESRRAEGHALPAPARAKVFLLVCTVDLLGDMSVQLPDDEIPLAIVDSRAGEEDEVTVLAELAPALA